MTKRFSIVSNEYCNTGGNCMVNITTVYDYQYKSLQYVFINEEYIVVSSYDYINQELHGEMTAEDFILHEIKQEEFTTEPSPEYVFKHDMDDDVACLLLDCMEAFIKNYVKHNKQNYFTTVDKLPNTLYIQVTDEYRHWLEERNQLVETDGYAIFIDENYIKHLEVATPNEKAAKELQQHLAESIKRMDTDDENEREEFYCEKLHIIYCGKLFTFDNGADVYNGLAEFTEFVISEQ